MLMPTVGTYMTRQPWTISSHDLLDAAYSMMRAHGIRHLPVVDDGHLVGMVSDRDLARFEALSGTHHARVRDAMTEPVFTVAPGETIDHVARVMAERKLGSAVVVAAGTVTGILTAVDVCRAVSEILERAVS